MNTIHTFVHRLHNPDLATLFIRIAVGVVFIHAGWLKLMDMGMVVTGFAASGFPAWVAYFVAYAELIGGILVLVGFLTRYAGIVLAIIMLVALFKVHLPSGFGLQNGGIEYVFVLLLGALALLTQGSGKYSLARLFRRS